jgi:predicted secreted hydrolase
LTLDGEPLAVEGSTWFDHQWGDFITGGAGGWDWFAINLDDGTDVMAYLIRAPDGSIPVGYATVAGRDTVDDLTADQISVTALGSWTSPHTGTTYPSGWTIALPGNDLTINLQPTVLDQELDTRASTGVVYWEGSQVVEATRGGQPVDGEAYVELTGYLSTN